LINVVNYTAICEALDTAKETNAFSKHYHYEILLLFKLKLALARNGQDR
jgi:hypothetical protein